MHPYHSYITNQEPMKYGGQQANYLKETQELISWGARKIQTAPKDKNSLAGLFFELLDHFEEGRGSIAIRHKTLYAEQFGRRRSTKGHQAFYHTYLDGCYAKYNPKILSHFAKLMEDMPLKTHKHPKQTAKTTDSFLDYSSSFEVEVLEGADLNSLKWLVAIDPEEMPKEFRADLMEKRKQGIELSDDERLALKQSHKDLKEKHSDIYRRMKMTTLFEDIQKEFPSPITVETLQGPKRLGNEANLKSFFALGTSRLSLDGKMYAMTQYLTWLYRDESQTDPVQRMLKCSTVQMIHQDNFLIDDTLKGIAQLFAKAILCKKNQLENLQTTVGLLRHYFAHCMPDERGSAAIGELMEGSIYRAMGYKITYIQDKQIDLEALTTPLLSEFMKNYPSMIKIEPLEVVI